MSSVDATDGDNSLNDLGHFDEQEEFQLSPCGSPVPDRDLNAPPSHSAALFIFKAKEERRVSQRALDGLLEDFQEICSIQKKALRDDVMKCLGDLKCSSLVITAVDQVIERSCATSPFDGLHTAYLQQQYFQTHFHFVVSYTHNLPA